MTLYQRMEAALPADAIDGHESDLYVRDCPEARVALMDYNAEAGSPAFFSAFRSLTDGGRLWLDIPFFYAPFWETKRAQGKARLLMRGS